MHGWMGMDVWVKVFTMPFLCADSGPWRKMSRAWPPMSAIMTSSGSTCPSHQESALELLKPGRKRLLWRLLAGVLLSGNVGVCVKHVHLQMFFVSTVLGKKASEVEQSWGAGADLPGRRPPPHWTGRGPVNESIMFGELSVLLFFFCFLFF